MCDGVGVWMIPSHDFWIQLGQKVEGHYKIQSGTKKRTNFVVLDSPLCFEDIITMHAASVSAISN